MSSVLYRPIDGEKVSREWLPVLLDMREDGVAFRVNEGHRTWARQEELVRQKGVYSASNRTGAARLSASAPHIRTGRIDHAIDFSNDPAVFAWLKAHGLDPARTVPGESWHIEVSAAKLRAYKPARDKLDGYTASEKRWIREYDRLARSGKDAARRRVLRRVMSEQRKRIWRAAQAPGGWQKANRAARYASLKSRTT